MSFDRFDCVLGTGGPETTVIPEKRADRVLVGFDRCQYQAAHFFSSFTQSLCKHFLISSLPAVASGTREIMTISSPLGFSRRWRKNSLIRRFARLRPTAVFICFFEMASPRREIPSPFERYNRISSGSIIRRDSAKVNLKSLASVSLDRRGKAASTVRARDSGADAVPAGRYVKSGGKPGTALRTPRAQNQTAAAGFHSGAKPVGALTLEIAGLICSFHVPKP